MQIHELTSPSQQQLDEVVGGLARMAGRAMARSGLGQAVGQAASDIKQGFQQSGIGKTLSKAGDIQQQSMMQAQSQALAAAAQKQWNNKVLQLMQANSGQPVSDPEYTDHLKDFIQKTMMGNRPIDSLDQNSSSRLSQAISGVIQNRNDKSAMPKAFQQLTNAAMAARLDPSKFKYQPAASARTNMTTQQAKTAVTQFMQQGISGQQQAALKTFLQQNTGTLAVNSTGNPVTDALLNQLGIQTR